MNSQEIKKAAKEMIVEYQKVLSLNISDEKRNEVKKMLREARKAKKNPELVYGSINRVVNLNLDMDNFLFQFKFKDPKSLKTKKYTMVAEGALKLNHCQSYHGSP